MKRTLCLVLALIFAVGICFSAPVTITASAAEGDKVSVTINGGTYGELDANVNYDIIATAMTADELEDAVTAWLADGNTDISILLTAYADQEMFSAIWTAFSESTAADGSIDLTISGAKTVPDYGFFDNDDKNIAGDKLKSLTLTDVETIGDFAFSACTYLESVNLPQVVTIGEYAFNEWKKGTKLTSLNLPNATTIGDWAFAYSSLLTSVNLPKVTSIGEHAFGYCDLRTLDLPEATTIGGEAFMNNDNIVSCSAPKATTIGYYPWGSNRTSKLERLELTAAGDFTLGNNLFAYTPTEQIDLVLNKDKESQVTQNEDGTATWATTNQYGGSLTYTFKSITLTCVDGTTNHSYTYTDQENGTHKAECTVEGCGFYKYEAHTFDANSYTDNNDGTHDATCTACGAVVVDNEAHTGGTATCTTLAVCENCGTEYGDKDTLNHKDTLVQVDAKAPTCTEIGWDAYEYCTACDYSTYEEIPASTHIDANCDYKCDYNCGYEYETPDFSDAKILTVNDEGVLCIDGVAVVCKDLGYSVTEQYIPAGKYKLASDISILYYNTLFHTDAGSDVEIDLNGYTWSSKKFVLYVQGSLSIYDTSAENTGKIISTDTNGGILTYNGAREINLYNGTLENIDISVYRDNCVVNLYGGKIKCDGVAILCSMEYSSIINIYDTVLETSDGVAHIDASIYNTDVAKAVINVADYSGDGLTIDAWIDITGKFKLLEGIENAQEAEKYTIKFYKNDSCYLDKTEYNEETGEMFAYTAKYAFTQQPSAENGYTVDFNNPDATFQWYEVEETILTPDNVTAIEGVIFENEKWLHGGGYVEFFTVDANAGDMITASTTSDCSFDLNVYTEDYSIDESVRTTGKASVTIDSDAKVIVEIDVNINNETTEFEIELIKISEVDETETDKTLQNPECGKTYVCKTSVGENVYLSDVVTVGHNIVAVNVQAPTCTEIGWEAYEYCTACDYTTYEEKEALDHDWSNKDGICERENCGYKCPHETITDSVCVACGGNYCGTDTTKDKVIWFYDEDTTTLTISGTGAMADYDNLDDMPWYNYQNDITKVVIENGVTTIGEFAFAKCTSLEAVTIGEGVTTIGDYAFSDCTFLTTLTIGNKVSTIGDSAFSNCAGLTSVTIPDSVATISGLAFDNCSNLTSVTIPKNVTTIGRYAFAGCAKLISINVDGANTKYSSVDGVLFNANKTELICYPLGKTETSYTVPESVTTIVEGAFKDCTALTSVTIGKGVTEIYDYAFEGFEDVNLIVEPGSKAHNYAKTNSIPYIFNGYTKEETAQIKKLTFTLNADSESYSVTGCDTPISGELKIPATYNGKPVTSIGIHAFSSCTSLETVTIGNSVTSIGDYAFSACTALATVTIPDSVTTIGNYTFNACRALATVTIPDSVTTIGNYIFNDCTTLATVTIGKGVTTIGDYAFNGCNKLLTVNVPCDWDTENPPYAFDENVLKKYHNIVIDEAVAATCTKTGLTEGQHCTRCDDKTVAQEVVPALNHKGTLVQVEEEAKTCTTVGWEAYEYCTACDYTTYVEIPASHELQEEKAKAPTCEAIGWDAYKHCTDCNYTTYVEKAKLGHDIVIDKAKAATCTATGLTEGSHCSRCDDKTVKQDIIPKKGHTEIKGGTEGAHTICDVCEDVLSAEHEFAKIVTKEPTQLEMGVTLYSCSCGYSYEEEIACVETGEIEAEVDKSNSFSASVEDVNSIIAKLQLTDEEKALIEQGADMKIVFKLSDIGATINTPEKEAIFKALTNEKIAVFLDIQLVKQIANSSVNVQKLNDLIKVTVELPAELVNKDGNIKRSYSVLRYHDGDETKVTTLNAKFDEATGTLTFDTDRFSTYAIVYSDVVVSDGEGASGTPDSGDGEVSTPENPKNETTPNTPEVPKDNVSNDKNDDSVTNDKNDASSETGTNDKNDTSKDDVPKAGVISTTSIWLGAMALSGLGALLVSKKKKEND